MVKRVCFVMALICIFFVGCNKQSEQSSPEAIGELSDGEAEENVPLNLFPSDMLVGFIAPESTDFNLRATMHGFLRTAETIGFPAKLYYASAGVSSVEAVERAKAEGCLGLLIWNANNMNSAAIARASELGMPVVVPYYQTDDNGVKANVVADQLGYAEEIALCIAERMMERECKSGKILIYGRDPQSVFSSIQAAIAEYYPQFNVGYFVRSASVEQDAINELAEYILWNRDIKGLFAVDSDGSKISVRARELAIKTFRDSGAPEAAAAGETNSSGQQAQSLAQPIPAGATPVPEGLIKSIVITVTGYGLNDDVVELISKNDIYAFVVEPYYESGAQSLMLLEKLIRGEGVPRTTKLNMPIARMATLDKYVLIREQVLEWFS